MPHFDWTIRFSDIIVMSTGIIVTFRLVLAQDRINNKILTLLGDETSGLVHDVHRIMNKLNVLELWRARQEARQEGDNRRFQSHSTNEGEG